jgi:hypothetical protein
MGSLWKFDTKFGRGEFDMEKLDRFEWRNKRKGGGGGRSEEK